jgi:hypothetical protein
MPEPHPNPDPRRRRPHYRWLLVLPFVWQVGLTPAVNGVSFDPLNVPFPMWWQMAGVVFTTLIIGAVFVLDRRHGTDDEPGPATQPATGSAVGGDF